MKKIIILSILILSFKSSFSQKKIPPEVIEKGEVYLKNVVGENLFKYFELAPWYIEYYQHKTKARKRIRKKNYNHKKKNYTNIKKIGFKLNHPDFQYTTDIHKSSYIILDYDLNLIEKINIDYIPKFLLDNKPSNLLSENRIDSIAQSKKTKKGIKPISKILTLDKESKKYYWSIMNVFNNKSRFSCDVEMLHVDPISGVILKQFEDEAMIFRH